MSTIISQTPQMEWTAEHTWAPRAPRAPRSHAKAQRSKEYRQGRGGPMSHAKKQRRQTGAGRTNVSRKEAKAQRGGAFLFSSQPEAYQDSISHVSRKGAKTQRIQTGETDCLVLSLLSFYLVFPLRSWLLERSGRENFRLGMVSREWCSREGCSVAKCAVIATGVISSVLAKSLCLGCLDLIEKPHLVCRRLGWPQ